MRQLLQVCGFLAFAIGLLLSLIAGVIAPGNGAVILILAVLGLIVGLFNVKTTDMVPLLLGAIALVVVGNAGFGPLDQLVSGLGTRINEIVNYLAKLMAPAAVIGAVRALISVGFPKN